MNDCEHFVEDNEFYKDSPGGVFQKSPKKTSAPAPVNSPPGSPLGPSYLHQGSAPPAAPPGIVSISSKSTHEYTVVSQDHGRMRRAQRDISKRDLQKAR